MQLKKLNIKNYKRLLDVELSLEDDITLIAGPNNSGKTSIIEVLKFLFTENKDKIEISELNISLFNNWINDFYECYKNVLDKKKEGFELIEELTNFLNDKSISFKNFLPEINIEVSYDRDKDNLSDIIKYSFELDENNSVYFVYQCELNLNLFQKNLINSNKKISDRYNNSGIKNIQKEKSIKKIIKNIIQTSIEEKYYYTNSKYLEKSTITKKEFKSLFNIKIINALRKLDDIKNDSNNSLSKSMVDIASKKEDFVKKMDNISDSLIQKFEDEEIENIIVTESMNKFNSSVKETSGSESFAEVNLLINPDTSDINALLKDVSEVQYSIDSFLLGESSQGLGYSNMVYLHMYQQNFEDNIDDSKVNIMIIEEPESHMHPQMQYSFFTKIMSYYENNSPQCIDSTHSTDIINSINNLSKIRVVRGTKSIFSSKIYDLRKFVDSIKDKKYDSLTSKIEFYDFFFNVGLPNIIFSNKVILFEGDSERIFLKRIIKDKFDKLYKDYISFIQVGGAYAKNYFDIIKFLNIKTLVLTDIDYEKRYVDKDCILKSHSSNATINYSYNNLNKLMSNLDFQVEECNLTDEESNVDDSTELDLVSDEIKISDIYNWLKEEKNEIIGIFTQTEMDNYSRTLEESMLTKYLDMNIWDTKTTNDWKKIRKENNIRFSIPRTDGAVSIRDIINSSSQNKTDFMYSVILSNKYLKMIPYYIQKGLEWLENE